MAAPLALADCIVHLARVYCNSILQYFLERLFCNAFLDVFCDCPILCNF